jgi:CubicO group peptidase (beta-lactamase class C family)
LKVSGFQHRFNIIAIAAGVNSSYFCRTDFGLPLNTMNYRLTLIVVVILFAFNEPLVTHKAEFSSDFLIPGNARLTNELTSEVNIPQIERGFNAFMRRWHIAGASVAISKDGRLVYARGFGYADIDKYEEAQPFHRFRIASISKLVTAVAVMNLCEEGVISVNDKVFGPTGILNDSLYSSPRDKRVYSITVGHLLGHRGGWTPRYGDHMFLTQVIAKGLEKELPLSTPDYVRFALNKNLHFTPGSGRSYSNLGYAILGMVVEKASGMSYGDYCQKAIFEPLGIYDFALGGNLLSQRLVNEVRYYEHDAAIPKISVYGTEEIVPASYGGNDIESLGGAGSWVATAPDLMRFMLAIDGLGYNNDLLSEETIEFMTNEKNGYAPLGWKATMGNGVWWRTGSFPGTTAMMKRLPGGISWVVLFNTSAWNGPELTNDINGMMSRLLSQVKEWPDQDLFRYSLPVPLKDYITEDNQE